MKKLILSLATAVLLVVGAQAQTEFGLKVGVNFPSYSYADSEVLADAKPAVGFYLAGYMDARIASGFYLSPEVSLQEKGAKLVESNLFGGDEVIQSVMWSDLSVNFLGKVPVGGVSNVFAGAGPYVGFAMNGKNRHSNSNSTSVFVLGKENTMRTTDYGINLLVGFKLWNRWSLNANYRLGMANIAGDTYKWSKNIKNRVFSLGVGVSL